jgi:hypothetical protein
MYKEIHYSLGDLWNMMNYLPMFSYCKISQIYTKFFFSIFSLFLCPKKNHQFFFITYAATLTLGSRPRQGGCKVARLQAKREARESPHMLLRMSNSVRE